MDFNTFPFKTTFSLSNLIGYYELLSIESTPQGNFARAVLHEIDKHPELRDPMPDIDQIRAYQQTIDLVLSAVFPQSLVEDELTAVVSPFATQTIATTAKLGLLLPKGGDLRLLKKSMPVEEMYFRKTIYAYSQILSQCYGINLPVEYPITVTMQAEDHPLEKHFRIIINPKFMEIKVNGALPELSDKDLDELKQNVFDLEVWRRMIPSEKFEFLGFAILSFEDITEQEALSRIKFNLLEKDTILHEQKFQDLQNNLRVFFDLPGLWVGLSSIFRNDLDYYNFNRNIRQSFIMSNFQSSSGRCDLGRAKNVFGDMKVPKVFSDLSIENPLGEIGEQVLAKGIKNVIVIPLFDDEELIGVLELGSPNSNELNNSFKFKFKEICPLFEIAVKRGSDETDNQIRAIIKEEYTAIHPSVEWRFINAAFNILEKRRQGIERPEPEMVIFEDVYPLYAAYDIRSSSILRNDSIRADMTRQLSMAMDALEEINNVVKMPLLEEISYRINNVKMDLQQGLVTDDGESARRLLQGEIEPMLKTFDREYSGQFKTIAAYFDSLDDDLGIIYDKRKDFELSVNRINEALAKFLDKEQVQTQKIFPHYCEKYNTDGLEYNIYIGQSIVKSRKFEKIHLSNMRLWQLISTCKVAYMNKRLAHELTVPLQLTNLILVHSTKMSIKFRMDEKQFDVDGAYNVRYEILKKRIDKALIKDSNERLTQPDKIAIVYSNVQDKEENLRYLDFLRNRHFIKDEIEELELEELQGVNGLSALRVAINYDHMAELETYASQTLLEELDRVS
jgi:hypothetical protein